ncbi:hypothetical protein PCE1_004025 [Barthelona sp. PCE]
MSEQAEVFEIPEEYQEFIERVADCTYVIKPGFVPEMKTSATFYLKDELVPLMFEELSAAKTRANGFIPALKQVANVASLPGIVGNSMAMPDIHAGYGFSIGGVAAFDMDDEEAIVSPGGVGFDINCGVRMLRTNLQHEDLDEETINRLAQELFNNIPVGVGQKGPVKLGTDALRRVLEQGVDWAIKAGYAWPEDKEHCEEQGRMLSADSRVISKRALKRGCNQLGTLGAGNHYIEVQRIDEIFDEEAAAVMGLEIGQIVLMIHTGSRGLGHQVATDSLREMKDSTIPTNDPQLACAHINSEAGERYLKAMGAAANYAFANRQVITHLARQSFANVFDKTPEELDMHLIYDVSHNIAKMEEHIVDGETKRLLVHRKGATRAFPPHHPMIPADYQEIGQPVLIGGTMGTASYILVGTEKWGETFGSTCHGAGRTRSRHAARRQLDTNAILQDLEEKKIVLKVASQNLVKEEAVDAYKNIEDVIDTVHTVGFSKKVARLRPVAVVKG